MKKAGKFFVIAAALALAGAGGAEARSGGHGGGGHSGGGHSGGGHAGARGYSHSGGYSHSRGYHGPRVVVGVPYYYPYWRPYYYFPAPAYYDPAPAYYEPVFAPPVEYIEQGSAAQGAWFYCAQSGAYYPDVLQCPGGWQRVEPRPPSPQ
jgi:hypothetical protein